MRRLGSALFVFLLATTAWCHTTDPPNGGAMIVSYFETPGPGKISVLHFPTESCVVIAEAVEIVITTPLLSIQSMGPQPSLDAILSVKAIRHRVGDAEITSVHLIWGATGATTMGTIDPDCNGSGDVVFA